VREAASAGPGQLRTSSYQGRGSAFPLPHPGPLPEGEGAAAVLPESRLHLQHGPIDLVCQAWGDPAEVRAACRQAAAVFPAILPALCMEMAALRAPLPSPPPQGPVAQAMHAACTPHAGQFITPMAAVAGAVADAVLRAMTAGRTLERACVNNGGDIAFHLSPGQSLRCGLVAELAAPALDGVFTLHHAAPSRGIATSGRACKGQGGRSFSFGIADAVTVLARTAAEADAAATVVANAVDLPGHPAVRRHPADDIDPGTDLGSRLVTWDLGPLTPAEVDRALDAGRRTADALRARGLIHGAVLALRGRVAACLPPACLDATLEPA
jgi:ApbE superfamily uncharacterized protein (UPF0280 family)